jgi:hypothetical protein
MPHEGEVQYTFTPETTGTHHLKWAGNSSSTLRPVRCSAPVCFYGESQGIHFFRPTGALHFAVPSGVARFAVQVAGSGTLETVKATLRNGSGRVVDTQDNIAQPHVFVAERDNPATTEVYSVTLQRAGEGVLEDVFIHTLGIPAVFSTTATDALAPVAD